MPTGHKFDKSYWEKKQSEFLSFCATEARSVGELEEKFSVYGARMLRRLCEDGVTLGKRARQTVYITKDSKAEAKHRAECAGRTRPTLVDVVPKAAKAPKTPRVKKEAKPKKEAKAKPKKETKAKKTAKPKTEKKEAKPAKKAKKARPAKTMADAMSAPMPEQAAA